MHTKFDYETVRENSIYGWEQHWINLLEGRFAVIDNHLVEDKNSKIFQLGFTVEDVESATGHTGSTEREFEWYTTENPGRYELVDGKYQEVSGWAEEYASKHLAEAKEIKKAEIDGLVKKARSGYFRFDGHNFHPDNTSILGKTVEMLLSGAEWTIQWKTADKDESGQSVWVRFDSATFKLFAAAYDQHMTAPWAAGCVIKANIDAITDIADLHALSISI